MSRGRRAKGASAQGGAPASTGPRGGRVGNGVGRVGDAAERGRVLLRRMAGNRPVPAVLVPVALVALFGVATFSRPSATAPAPEPGRVAVTSAVAVCPDPAGSRVAALTPVGARTKGRVDVTSTGSMGTPRVALTRAGTAWHTDVEDASGSWTFRATGPMAGGLSVQQTTVDHGVAGIRCAEPEADAWFLGPGPAAVARVDLFLTDVDEHPVPVDIEVMSEDGPVDLTGVSGTVVDPHSTRRLRLDGHSELARALAEAKALALHVHADTGRVAAAVRVVEKKNRGVEWLPVTTAPTKRLVVPGVASGSGKRRLLVAVPGGRGSTVTVRAATPDGAALPIGADTARPAARTVTSLDLGLGEKPAGIVLTADHPITAAVVEEKKIGDGKRDIAVAAAGTALTTAGAVADGRAKSTLSLTAPEGDAVVRVTDVTAHGVTGPPQEVRVRGGRTVEVPVEAPADGSDGYGIVVAPRPGSGPVYAARLLEIRKRGVTVSAVRPSRGRVSVPAVVGSVTVPYR